MFHLLGLCLQGMGFAEKEALDHYFLNKTSRKYQTYLQPVKTAAKYSDELI